MVVIYEFIKIIFPVASGPKKHLRMEGVSTNMIMPVKCQLLIENLRPNISLEMKGEVEDGSKIRYKDIRCHCAH